MCGVRRPADMLRLRAYRPQAQHLRPLRQPLCDPAPDRPSVPVTPKAKPNARTPLNLNENLHGKLGRGVAKPISKAAVLNRPEVYNLAEESPLSRPSQPHRQWRGTSRPTSDSDQMSVGTSTSDTETQHRRTGCQRHWEWVSKEMFGPDMFEMDEEELENHLARTDRPRPWRSEADEEEDEQEPEL